MVQKSKAEKVVDFRAVCIERCMHGSVGGGWKRADVRGNALAAYPTAKSEQSGAPSHGELNFHQVEKGWEHLPFRAKGLTWEGNPFGGREHDQKRESVKRGNVVVPASPARMEKLEAEPAAKRKLSLCPTRCNSPSTVASL
jgi:hypothetical protein